MEPGTERFRRSASIRIDDGVANGTAATPAPRFSDGATEEESAMHHVMTRPAAIAAAALVLTLAACGGGDDGGGSSSSGAVKSLRVLDYYNNEPDKAFWAGVLDACGKANGVTIERETVPGDTLIQKVLQQSSSKTLPDVLMLDNPDLQQIAETGALADLTSSACRPTATSRASWTPRPTRASSTASSRSPTRSASSTTRTSSPRPASSRPRPGTS